MRRSRHHEVPGLADSITLPIVDFLTRAPRRRSRSRRQRSVLALIGIASGTNAVRRKHCALDFRDADVHGKGVVIDPAEPHFDSITPRNDLVEPRRADMQSERKNRDSGALKIHGLAHPREKRFQPLLLFGLRGRRGNLRYIACHG